MYVYYFDIASIVLTATLLLMMFLRRTYSTLSCKIYKGLLWLNLVSSVFDLISAFTIPSAAEVALWLNYVINITYLLSHNVTCILFMWYVVVITKGREQSLWRTIIRITGIFAVVFETLMLFITPFTKWVFYFDENFNYIHGPLFFAYYGIALAIMLYTLLLFVLYNKKLNKFQNVTNIVFLVMLIFSVVFQMRFNNLLIESFCVSIGLLIMNVATDNPAMYFYNNTYCFNHTAFNTMVGEKLSKKEKITLLGMAFDNIMMYRSKYGNDLYHSKVDSMINILHKKYGQKNVYTFSGATFVIVINDKDVESVVKDITLEMRKLTTTSEERNYFTPHYCVMKCPEFAETVGEVNDSMVKMLNEVYKTTGDTVTYASSKELREKRRISMITHKLHNAIQNDGFEVYFQPIYNCSKNHYNSLEALVRLKDQDANDYIGPDEFIPIAESNGMILEIDEIVFEKVCRLWQNDKLEGLGVKFVEINISRVELLNGYVLDRMEELCRRYKLPMERINLEITETAVLGKKDNYKVSENVNKFIEKGFTFSLDDYGSGYSSAGYLAEMPFEIVKVDKNILWNAMTDSSFKVVLENAISIVHRLGRKCVVEGVETEEMVKTLKSVGCEYLQGYYFSKPLCESDLIEFLMKNNKADIQRQGA